MINAHCPGLSRAASTDKRWRHHARSLGVNKSILMRGRREKYSNLCDAACHGHGGGEGVSWSWCTLHHGGSRGVLSAARHDGQVLWWGGSEEGRGVLNDIWTPAIRAHFREISAVMTFTWASLSRKCLVKPSLARFELDLSPPQLARLYLWHTEAWQLLTVRIYLMTIFCHHTMRTRDNILMQVPQADAGDRRDVPQQADLHLEDRGPGPGNPAQPHPVTGILHYH